MSYSPLYDSANARGTARSLSTGFVNGHDSTLDIGQPVSVNASSQMIPLDVSSEASVQAFLGVVSVSTPSAATGQVLNAGRVEDVTTGFAVGDAVYAGKLTALTNSKPSIGVAGFASGDFCILLGVLVKNEFNASLKDIQLVIQIVGQL